MATTNAGYREFANLCAEMWTRGWSIAQCAHAIAQGSARYDPAEDSWTVQPDTKRSDRIHLRVKWEYSQAVERLPVFLRPAVAQTYRESFEAES